MSNVLTAYVSLLCDKYSHFGEYIKEECKVYGIPPYGKVLKTQVSNSTLQLIYAGKRGIGPEASKAFGNVLNVPEGHYQKLFELFKAEKARRAKV